MVLLGYNGFITNNDFWDKAENLPFGFIIQREIVKAFSGENFFYNDENGEPVYLSSCSKIFNTVYEVWENFHILKILPHGKGTIHEQAWVLQVIKNFEKIFKRVKIFLEEKAYKAIKNG